MPPEVGYVCGLLSNLNTPRMLPGRRGAWRRPASRSEAIVIDRPPFYGDANFGLHLMGHWSRDLGVLDLSRAVHRLTGQMACEDLRADPKARPREVLRRFAA